MHIALSLCSQPPVGLDYAVKNVIKELRLAYLLHMVMDVVFGELCTQSSCT